MFNYSFNEISPETIDANTTKYCLHVLDPEHNAPARIPSPFPVKTALANFDRVDTLATDSNGNLVIRASFPEVLTTNSTYGVSYVNDGTWNPVVNSDSVTLLNSLNVTSFATYSNRRIRVVAYKIKLRYIGSELNRSGIFFGAHDFSNNISSNTTVSSIRQLQDGPYFELHSTLDGIEVCYKPYDNSYLEFSKATLAIPETYAYWWFAPYTIYAGILGGQPSSTVILVEQFLTIEYIPAFDEQDLVGTEECVGNPEIISKLNGKDVVRKANEIADKPSLFSKIGSFLQSTSSTALGALKEGIIATMSSNPLIGVGAKLFNEKSNYFP